MAHEEVIAEVRVEGEADIVRVRQTARLLAAAFGLQGEADTRFSTMVGEAARYVFSDCQPAYLRFWAGAVVERRYGLGMEVSCRRRDGMVLGPDATDLAPGLFAAFGLVDHHDVAQAGEDTVIRLHKLMPDGYAPAAESIETLRGQLGHSSRLATLSALRRQNHDLLARLLALHQRQSALRRQGAAAPASGESERLYAALESQASELARLGAAKNAFLSSVGHELRGPLSSIHSLSRLLLARTDGELTPGQQTQIGFIHNASGDLLALVDDLADLARVEAGSLVLRLGEFDIAHVYAGLRDTFAPLVPKPGVALAFEVPPQGQRLVYSDRHKVAQILRNLIVNALKFTVQGSVRVSCTEHADAALRLEVADTGIGIAAADLELIFDEFVRLDSEPARQARGSGLGLALSRRLAEAIGASIDVRSQLGVGSVFALVLPHRLVPGENQPADRAPEPAR